MGLVSLDADIVDRRSESGARVIYEYQQTSISHAQLDPQASKIASMAKSLGMTPAELIEFRQWVRRVTKECDERLANEMTVVYTLNKQRTRILKVEYVTKAEATEVAPVAGGELLDLDQIFGGVLVRGCYVFVSDQALEDGLTRYRPHELLDGLISERLRRKSAA